MLRFLYWYSAFKRWTSSVAFLPSSIESLEMKVVSKTYFGFFPIFSLFFVDRPVRTSYEQKLRWITRLILRDVSIKHNPSMFLAVSPPFTFICCLHILFHFMLCSRNCNLPSAAQRCALPAGGRDEITPFWQNQPQATQTAQKRGDSHQSGVSMK